MKLNELKQLINKAVKSELTNEGVYSTDFTVKDLRNKPGDSYNDTTVRLILMRKVTSNTAVYRLETDNWFRRYENPGKGYGIMIRKFRVGNTPVKPTMSSIVGEHHVIFNVLVTYLPNQFVNMDNDKPENWETSKGYLILGNKNLTGFEIRANGPDPKDFEQFVKMNIPKYVP